MKLKWFNIKNENSRETRLLLGTEMYCNVNRVISCKSTRQGALRVRAQGQGFLMSRNVNVMQYKS